MQVQDLTQKLHNKDGELQVKAADLQIKKQEADTHRMEVLKPDPQPHFDPIDAYRAQTERHEATKPQPPKDNAR
jgi:hypothetical protein